MRIALIFLICYVVMVGVLWLFWALVIGTSNSTLWSDGDRLSFLFTVFFGACILAPFIRNRYED